jgi:hypothetical protein
MKNETQPAKVGKSKSVMKPIETAMMSTADTIPSAGCFTLDSFFQRRAG